MCKRIILFLFFMRCLFLSAQGNSFAFSHLTEDDGLADNVVNCFLKDSRGIMWIGTYNGFSRFDGANFYNYKIRKGSNSMINEVVHSLCEDKQGNIWGATNNSVFCYMPPADSFINYSTRSFNRQANCENILCDRQGNIWAAAGWAVFKFNPAKKTFEETLRLADTKDSLRYYLIAKNGMKEDPAAKGLWLTTSSGIMYYDTEKQILRNYKNSAEGSLFRKRNVSALAASANGNCWFFDNSTKEIVLFNTAYKSELRKINVRNSMPAADGGTLFEDGNQRLWFSSWSYEMIVIDQQKQNQVTRLQHHEGNKSSVAGTFFWAVYEDEDKNIWLGTTAGISKCNPDRTIYQKYGLSDLIPELKNTNIALAEVNPADSSIWIITASQLLIKYNPASGLYNVLHFEKAAPGPGGAIPSYCNSIKFFNGSTVICTRGGLWQVNKAGSRIVPYQFIPAGFEHFKCTDMAIDGDSVLYYTNEKDILYWNYVNGKATLIQYTPADNTAAEPKKVTALTFTRQRQLWMIASNRHIATLNAEKKLVVTDIIKDAQKEASVLTAIDQDSKNNVWVLNKGVGIYCYNPVSKTIKSWNATDGLTANMVHKLLTDNEDRIWSMQHNKVSVYLPRTGKFYNFKIPYNESYLNYYNHISRMASGKIFGTFSNEIATFYPERLLGIPSKGKPQISLLTVSGKDIPVFDGNNAITLQPKENTIRFRFGTNINKEVFPYDVEYKLEGAEKNWTIAGENNEAIYNNLNPGTYRFLVRVKGKNNGWITDEAALTVTIKAPFYKTTWFLLSMLIIVAAAIFFTYRYRINQKEKMHLLENKAQMLEKEKAMVMYENLKQQLNPHFLFNSLTSLNSLIETEPKAASEFLDSLSKTYRYILKSRDNEVVPLADEIRFAENYVKLQKTRFEKGFEVVIDIPEEYHHRKIVPVTLQNLIENAIKHNIIDEESPLMVKLFVENDWLVVENNLQKKKFVETSNRQGLSNMQSLYHYLSNRPVEITESEKTFTIKLPLL